MKRRTYTLAFAAFLPLALLASGCGDDSDSNNNPGNAGGNTTGGTGGSTTAGTGGKEQGGGGNEQGGGGNEQGGGGNEQGGGGNEPGGGGQAQGGGGQAQGGGGQGGSTTTTVCCDAQKTGGCEADKTLEACVCDQDEFCCTDAWDDVCISEIVKFGCGMCPGQCAKDADCTDAAKPLCEGGTCAAKCSTNKDCKGSKPTCDTASGKCIECQTNKDCTGSNSVCDTSTNTCKGCLANGDCKDPSKPLCDTKAGACAACLSDAECKDPAKPTCSNGLCLGKGNCCESTLGIGGCTDQKIQDCVCAKDDYCCTNSWDGACVDQIVEFGCGLCPGQCATNSDCKDPTKPLCDDNACVECSFGLDCKDPKKPACEEGTCKASSADKCVGDDTYEQADDSPNGATDITPDVGSFKEAKDHSICGSPASETDYFKVTVKDGEGLSIKLDWTDAKQDLDLTIVNSKGEPIGLDFFAKPINIKLTYLPEGTYYLSINRFDGQQGSTAVTPYTLRVERSAAAKCGSIADCAKEYENQFFRGSCNATTGACETIQGEGKVAEGSPCDSGDDCTSGTCAAQLLTKDTDKTAFCTKPCAKDAECSNGQICTTVYQKNFCTIKCTEDLTCPIDPQEEPESGPWSHLTCNTKSGLCELLSSEPTIEDTRT